MDELKEQSNNRPWLFKKGQSGNPKGRPPGKSLKERAKHMLNSMTEEEEQDFFDGLPKIEVWKMAEGNPETKTDITSKGEQIGVIDPKLVALSKKYEDEIKNAL